MNNPFSCCFCGVAVWLASHSTSWAAGQPSATKPSRESDAEHGARHARIAERRAGTIIIVHRGASAFAPENSLASYAAAMDDGADGCEVDLRHSNSAVRGTALLECVDYPNPPRRQALQAAARWALELTPRK